ncbi:MAG: WG repeat-containing protein, partial [Muribaculaceae bacterium]|nr:WG repeat-containing protein [Muribaculaceae bacterium]
LNVSAQDLIPQQNKKGKWGYVDANGNKVIDYRYDEATAFLEGSAKVKKGDKWGYIGKDGKEVIKIQYTEMQPWDASGRSKVAVGGKLKDNVLSGAKWGYISRTGNVLLKPEYDEIGPFKDGVAHVVKGGKYGYIDESFNYVIECRYSAVGTFNSEGLCWIAQGGKLAGKKINGAKFGICNRRGEVIVKPEYTYIGTFVEEIPEANPVMSRILNSQEARDRVGLLAKDASKGMAGKGFAASFSGKNAVNEVIEEAKDRMRKVYSTFVSEMTEGAAPSQIRMIQESRSYDMLGYRFVEQELFSMLDMSRAPYFAVSKTKVAADKDAVWLLMAHQIDKIGILDKYGKVLVKPGAYSVSFLPSEGLIPVVKANKKGFEVNYMQENGKLLMKKWVKADAVSPFVDGYAVIAAGQNQYLIDKMGQKVSSDYELILPPSATGHRIVKSAAGFGLVANKGNEILVPEWEMIITENNGLYCARKTAADKFGYINGDGAFEVQPLYDEARSFNGVTACVRTAAGWGVID